MHYPKTSGVAGLPHFGPHITPRGPQGLLCAGERRTGAPAPGGEAFPPASPAPSGSATRRLLFTQEGKAPPQPGREPGSARRSAARSPPSHRGAPGCPHPRLSASGHGASKVPESAAGGAAYLRRAALARRARAERRRGWRAPAAWCAPLGEGARRGRSGAEAGDRSRMPGAALRLTAPAAGLARAPPPPSSLLASRDARNCRRSGRTLAESPRARSQRPFPSPSAAGPHSPLLSPPLSPAGRHSVSLRLGGTGRGELRAGPAPPCAGTRQHA